MSELQLISTGDHYKDEVQNQWNEDACGSQYVENAEENTLDWYLEAEQYRYDSYAPWMSDVMEFADHPDEKVLEIGAGLGTDLAQFAKNGSICTDLDLSAGHLSHAKRNFELRGLEARFLHGDGETLPFDDNEFDVVYSNGVIHHTPNTSTVIDEIFRVLRPGGKAIAMVYAENSWHYWRQIVYGLGMCDGKLARQSPGDIMSEHVEISSKGQKPLVKVYTGGRLRDMFSNFEKIDICKRQLLADELPVVMRRIPVRWWMRHIGWNLIVKAIKPPL